MSNPELKARVLELELADLDHDAFEAFAYAMRGLITKSEALRRLAAAKLRVGKISPQFTEAERLLEEYASDGYPSPLAQEFMRIKSRLPDPTPE